MSKNFLLRVAAVLGLTITVAVLGTDTVTSASLPAQHLKTFIDLRTGEAISIQLDTAAPDAGHWVFRGPTATYVADAGAALKVNTPTSAVIDYRGPAAVLAAGGVRSTRTVKLAAQLDGEHHTAQVTLWDGRDRYHLVAKAADLGGLDATMSAVEAAITANDPVALYPLVNERIRAAYDVNSFASMWGTRSTALGRITALHRLLVGTPQVTDQGFWFLVADYSADVVLPSGATQAGFRAFFINEPSGWKLWTTTRH